MSKVFTGILSFLSTFLIVLKASGDIEWPWRWVLAPLWVPLVIAGVAVASALVVALFKGLWEAYKQC